MTTATMTRPGAPDLTLIELLNGEGTLTLAEAEAEWQARRAVRTREPGVSGNSENPSRVRESPAFPKVVPH